MRVLQVERNLRSLDRYNVAEGLPTVHGVPPPLASKSE